MLGTEDEKMLKSTSFCFAQATPNNVAITQMTPDKSIMVHNIHCKAEIVVKYVSVVLEPKDQVIMKAMEARLRRLTSSAV